MKKEAWELTGFRKTEDFVLYREFLKYRQQNAKITLDESILLFERADKCETLESFAKKKQRNAESYRKIYKKYFRG